MNNVADLYFVRHGQASFGQQNYDELSELGHEQARAVGKSLALHSQPSLFISGSLKRQKQTLQNMLEGFDPSLVADANHQVNTSFNEFNHDDVLNVVYPEYVDRSKMVEDLMKHPEPKRVFHKMYEAAVSKWIRNEGDYQEQFSEFQERVQSGFRELMSRSDKGQTTVVVSSAGPIAMCMKDVLGVSVEKAFALNEIMANTAVTRVLFNEKGECNLSFFNSYQHLPLNNIKITYR